MSEYKYVNFKEQRNSFRSKIESEIITLLLSYDLTEFQIPYDRSDLVLRGSGSRSIRIRSIGYIEVHEDDGLNHLRVVLYNADRSHIMFTALSTEDAVLVYDYAFRCIKDVKGDEENIEYQSMLRNLKSLELDKLVEWINVNTPYTILPMFHEGTWNDILSKMNLSINELVDAICNSMSKFLFSRNDKYVLLRSDGCLKSYGCVRDIWRDLGETIEACVKDKVNKRTEDKK